jgi:drug/metabolite transporter (DMT)-like permease
MRLLLCSLDISSSRSEHNDGLRQAPYVPLPQATIRYPVRRYSSVGFKHGVFRRMKSVSEFHLKTYVLIFFVVIFAPLGNVLLSKGMKSVGTTGLHGPADFLSLCLRIFTSPFIWLGIGFLLMFFVCYLLVLSWADYSFVQPASASSFGVVALLGHFALKEPISPTRWLGVVVICLGVLVVGNTHPRTTEHSR